MRLDIVVLIPIAYASFELEEFILYFFTNVLERFCCILFDFFNAVKFTVLFFCL